MICSSGSQTLLMPILVRVDSLYYLHKVKAYFGLELSVWVGAPESVFVGGFLYDSESVSPIFNTFQF